MGRLGSALLPVLLLTLLFPAPGRAAPRVAARTWVLLDGDSGVVLAGHDPHARVAMASLTKVMTALVALEHLPPGQRVRVVGSDLVGESSAMLAAGEDLSLATLLHGLILRSGNDAAMALARAAGGSPLADDPAARDRFVGWMNDRARSLELADTHFANPHGLDAPGHYSSAYDLAVITRAALANAAFLGPFGAASYDGDGHHYERMNKLPERYPGILGGKTGWTDDAGLCLIEVAQRGDRRLIMVLLGSTFERWYDDAADLLNYGWTLPRPALTPEAAGAVFAWWRARTDGPVAAGRAQRTWLWGQPLDAPRLEAPPGAPGA
ncbi:MAG: D-alanyl-D-alanine carboxypeptidase, partial [Thermomicrobiaceae bacterium]|nr:D-alanyl-D-alanine carboxypeptidase [Thermomicrobiaceae bacterium]